MCELCIILILPESKLVAAIATHWMFEVYDTFNLFTVLVLHESCMNLIRLILDGHDGVYINTNYLTMSWTKENRKRI